MPDVSTDLTSLSTTFGSHVEVLELDDLRTRVDEVKDAQARERMELARQNFDVDPSVVGDDFELDSLACRTCTPTTAPAASSR